MRREDIVAAYGQADRLVTRYAFAVVLATAGMLVTLALTPDDAELYAVLVGVAAVTAWFGGSVRLLSPLRWVGRSSSSSSCSSRTTFKASR